MAQGTIRKKKQNKAGGEGSALRLNKYLSAAGVASRREADELIREGKVSVNGKIVSTLGTKVMPDDAVRVGRKLVGAVKKIYFIMHKPRGYLCASRDSRGRPTVFDLLKANLKVFTVGRLDYNTEGLLIFTNDGEFSQALSHPANRVLRTYLVKVKRVPDEKNMKRMRKGVLVDGVLYKFSSVQVDRVTGMNSWLTVTLHEGKNRHIHKVCSSTGHHVIKIIRIRFGEISLGKLRPGEIREMAPREIMKLKKASNAA